MTNGSDHAIFILNSLLKTCRILLWYRFHESRNVRNTVSMFSSTVDFSFVTPESNVCRCSYNWEFMVCGLQNVCTKVLKCHLLFSSFMVFCCMFLWFLCEERKRGYASISGALSLYVEILLSQYIPQKGRAFGSLALVLDVCPKPQWHASKINHCYAFQNYTLLEFTMPSMQNAAPGTKSMKFQDGLNPFAPFLSRPVSFIRSVDTTSFFILLDYI